MSLSRLTLVRGIAALLALSTAIPFFSSQVLAQGSEILAPGQPVITGFPGTVTSTGLDPAVDPIDYTFIALDGHSVAIQELQPEAAPEGQLIDTLTNFGVTAADVGLVFGLAMDDAPETSGADAPNISVSATSAFGLHLTMPDAEGVPTRSAFGDPSGTRVSDGFVKEARQIDVA